MNDSVDDKRFSRRLREYALLASTVPAATVGADIIYMDGLGGSQLEISGPDVLAVFSATTHFSSSRYSNPLACSSIYRTFSSKEIRFAGDGNLRAFSPGELVESVPRNYSSLLGFATRSDNCR